MKWKKNLLLLFFLLAGVILGGLLANFCRDISALSWLAYGQQIGIDPANPMLLDLAIIQIAFGFTFTINVAQIITIVLCLFGYKAMVKKL